MTTPAPAIQPRKSRPAPPNEETAAVPQTGGTPFTTFGTAAPEEDESTATETEEESASEAATESEPSSTEEEDSGSGDEKRGGTLLLSLGNEPDLLDPAKSIQLVTDAVNDNIYARLVYIGTDRGTHPWLAESWDISSDGLLITFKIREGLTFHDGTALDGEAVKFHFDRILDPATASPALPQMGTLTTVELVDDLTVDFTLSAPYAPFFTNIFLSYGGIVSPTAVEQEGDNFGKKPVGAGPFKFKEWSTGQQIVLERFEEYQNFRSDMDNDGAPYVDAIQFKIISEDATRFAALQSGELHISDVDEKEIPNVQQDDNFQLIVWEEATNMSYFEYANKEPFTNLALRQAIAHAIDREGIVESAWNGYATPNLLPMPVGDAGWDASIGEEYGYPFDLEAAKQILLDDGFTEGSDGVLEKDGQRLEFSLLMYSGYESARISSEITQANLESIGMKVEIQTMELGAMIAALGEGEFDMNYMNWTWPDPVILSLLFKTPGWTNQMNNPELDALLTTADTTLDPEARIGAIHEALIYILQNAIIAPLATVWSVAAARKAVNGYKWDAVGYPNYVDVWLSDEG